MVPQRSTARPLTRGARPGAWRRAGDAGTIGGVKRGLGGAGCPGLGGRIDNDSAFDRDAVLARIGRLLRA